VDKDEQFQARSGHSMPMDWVVILAAVALSHALAGPADERWAAVLDGFDQVRSRAFEEGRADALEAVYPEGSELLEQDKELLASYVRRGVDIERMRMELLESEVVSATPVHVTLRVTDQLAQARVRLSDGTARDLPRDQPTRRTIELSLTSRGWRISRVQQQ